MKQLFSIEIKRAFLSKKLLIVLAIGLAICIHQWFYIQQYVSVGMFDTAIEYSKAYMQLPDILWSWWLGGCPFIFHGFLYFMILPILAALPFGSSYLRDLKDGHIKNIFTRSERKNYYLAKWLAVFLSGGTVATIPLALNFILSLTVFPAMGPYPESSGGLVDNSFLAGMFYTSPFMYIVFYLVIIFLFAGLFATLSLVITLISDYSFIVLLMPFLVILLATSVLDMFGLGHLSPQTFLFPGNASGDMLVILLELLVFALLSFVVFMRNGLKGSDY